MLRSMRRLFCRPTAACLTSLPTLVPESPDLVVEGISIINVYIFLRIVIVGCKSVGPRWEESVFPQHPHQ